MVIKKLENVLAKAPEKRMKKEKHGEPAMLTVGQMAPLLRVQANFMAVVAFSRGLRDERAL